MLSYFHGHLLTPSHHPVMKTLVPYTGEEKMDTVAVAVGMEVKDEMIQS